MTITLEPLTALPIGGTPKDPGRPPHLEWLAISTLRTNPAYQRPISAKGKETISKIVSGFSWGKFSPLIVRKVPGRDPLYEIIDGQHRATAALSIGYERVPAMIVQASDEEAARIFASVNVCDAMRLAAIDLMSAEAQVIEAKLAQRIGDGRSGQSLADIKAKVKDQLDRKIGAGIIATSMRLPYRVVEELIAQIRKDASG